MTTKLASVMVLLCSMAAVPDDDLRAQSDRPDATRLFITYRCEPVNRVAFLRSLESETIARFDTWRSEGVLGDYLLVHNQFVDANTWDAMVMVTFANYAQSARWRAMEKEFPGGLGADQLQLASPHTSYLADLLVAKGEPGDRSKSIFVVIPYEFRDKAEYVDYIKTYGVPQFDGWIREKAIANYGIYLNHHSPGKPWDVLLVFEYNGIDGLARRDLVKEKLRAELVADPAWKRASDNKREMRTEYEVVMASPVQPAAKPTK